MSEKVVPFIKLVEPPAADPLAPIQLLVTKLEALLDLAKKGKLRGLVYAGARHRDKQDAEAEDAPEGLTWYAGSAYVPTFLVENTLAAGLLIAQRELVNDMLEDAQYTPFADKPEGDDPA
jgi:hypothetical protein